jgi:tRNA threonylcarbamoyladenosine biosynthesis protein TsaB
MSKILCIESSGPVCSAAYFSGNKVKVLEEKTPYSHAEKLAEMTHELVQAEGKPDAVAISKGPGSYTGLRIGTSLAKGLCYGFSVPLISISTLKAMAAGYQQQHPGNTRLLCPAIDARRMEVYTAVYSPDLEEIVPVHPEIITPDSFASFKEQELLLFGDGADKCREVLSLHKNIRIQEDFFPSAIYIGTLAKHKFEKGIFENSAYFEPRYLKEFTGTGPGNKM